ncbi:DUF1648 domain-containing protein [Psychroserpens sp.]|uniref:DUF1648 domain-containing protein n=1 Tax=Psychroserpens sp. TaxID=2020870 RepID=UPI001B250E5C|nr:DUF1648 domain-containing protein [Psychroserpens sp.]MBO6606058.1 DUF1648 domain-containing protein [Psychroserpens sp.]MBO6630346.1 DUF1648 domain-containing protein [Psychroserpens sp.]MBO6652571.1 DUF1648 domain-containing protein [Psychroserpens sp.]MBO6681657.1 DUF1648 domain-containing protein [Psychroserpens sp.]MBO6749432.1 DUF1648 domain-containing protein [Psychroserpens sp.]
MKTNRPKIQVPLQGLDIILDMLSVTLLLLMIIFTIMSYSDLPETIPSHFDSNGNVDGYSSKTFLWLLPAIGLVTLIGLIFLNKYPHMHNYMVNITEENALRNYRLSTRIIRFTNLFTMLVFAIIVYAMIESAKGHTFNFGSWFIYIILGLSILAPVGILFYSRKINKS